MPIVKIKLAEPCDEATRQKLSQQLLHAAGAITGTGAEGISIEVVEDSDSDMASVIETTAEASASMIVRSYLSAMESRDLDEARGFLAETFQMTFPGGATFRTVEELVAWGKPRYQFVNKTYTCFDEMPKDEGAIVYCFGTLSGALPDGTPFEGVRFIDRFMVSGNKLTDQLVWNDLAETLKS